MSYRNIDTVPSQKGESSEIKSITQIYQDTVVSYQPGSTIVEQVAGNFSLQHNPTESRPQIRSALFVAGSQLSLTTLLSLAIMTRMPSLRRRQSGISDLDLESHRQGCVFDPQFDVLTDTMWGCSYLPSAHQRPARTRVPNFSLSSYCDKLPLIPDVHVALVQGNENHNRNPPVPNDEDLPSVPKDLTVDEPSRRKCLSPFAYLGPDNQLCQIPPIVLTEGQDDLTHVSQLQKKLRARPLGMFPPSISELRDIVTELRVPESRMSGAPEYEEEIY
jgi:hypothetical protein